MQQQQNGQPVRYVIGPMPETSIRARAERWARANKGPSTVIGVVLAILALFAVTALCRGMVEVGTALTTPAYHTTTTSAVSTATPHATATVKPTATAMSPSAIASNWKKMAISDGGNLMVGASDVTGACSNEGAASCALATQQFQTTLGQVQGDLTTHPAPVCLSTANADLHHALAMYNTGATDIESGQVTRGVREVNAGDAMRATATGALLDANC